MKVCLYASVSDKNLFCRVGFYRDDIAALRLHGDQVIATNSLRELLFFRPKLIVSYFFTKSILTILCGRLLGARVLLTGGADQISPILSNGFRLFIRRALAFLCLLFAHRILLSCSDDYINFHKLCFNVKFLEKKLSLVNHVVIPSPYPSGMENNRIDQFHAFTLCWMGSESNVKRKGVDKAIRLIALLRRINVNASLVIAGTDGPGRLFLDNLIHELHLNEHVSLLGPISEDEKNVRLSSGCVYLQLSEHEGFGVAAAEAFFSGMIVVHSNQGGLRDVIGENGLIIDPAILETSDMVAISDFYREFLNYKINADFLKKNIGNYSVQMRSEAFYGVV